MHCLNRICPAFTFTPPLHRLHIRRPYSQANLFVGGISYDTNETVLKDTFKEFGEIIEVKVICDRWSGKSRGYGFVHYTSDEAATKAIKEMDGQLLEGRKICVRHAQRKEKQASQV